MDARLDAGADGRKDRRTCGRTGGLTEGRTDDWTDGRTDGRMDGRTERKDGTDEQWGPSYAKTLNNRTNCTIEEKGYWCNFWRGIGGYWRVLGGIGGHVQTRGAEPVSNSPHKPMSAEQRISLRGVLERHLRSYYNTNKGWDVSRAQREQHLL